LGCVQEVAAQVRARPGKIRDLAAPGG
jgi:hypothetical protein